MSFLGIFSKSYKDKIIQICSKHELPIPVKHYLESLQPSREEGLRDIRIEVLTSVCYSRETLEQAIKCLDEIMQHQ